MKKIISIILAVLMAVSMLVVPVFATDDVIKDEVMIIIPIVSTRYPTEDDIQDIFKKMGISTWGSGYFGCHMMNPEGDPAPDSVIHQYIQSAGLLEGYEAEWEETNQWGTFTMQGYELPYEKYIEIIDSAFSNHSDMKSFLNNEWNQMYDEKTGMVKWGSGGFGGPTDWVVQEVYYSSDSLIYATGVMVEMSYTEEDFIDKKENFDYVTVTGSYGTTKGMLEEAIILTLQKEDGKWKILEYRENTYHIVDDVLYDLPEETSYNRLTIEKTGAVVEEDENSKDFMTSFYGNGSRWYCEGQEISFRINEQAGYELKGVSFKDENGEKAITGKDGVYTIAPKGTAVLTVETEKISVEIEIAKPEDRAEIKVSESKAEVFAVVDKTVEELNSAISEDTEILKADGTKAKAEDKIASGMQLVVKNEDGEVIDIKTVVVPGDVDGDAAVLANDARLALRASVDLEELGDWESSAADVDGEKEVKASDARNILRASVELEDTKDWLAVLQ